MRLLRSTTRAAARELGCFAVCACAHGGARTAKGGLIGTGKARDTAWVGSCWSARGYQGVLCSREAVRTGHVRLSGTVDMFERRYRYAFRVRPTYECDTYILIMINNIVNSLMVCPSRGRLVEMMRWNE